MTDWNCDKVPYIVCPCHHLSEKRSLSTDEMVKDLTVIVVQFGMRPSQLKDVVRPTDRAVFPAAAAVSVAADKRQKGMTKAQN